MCNLEGLLRGGELHIARLTLDPNCSVKAVSSLCFPKASRAFQAAALDKALGIVGQLDRLVGRPPGIKACFQPFGLILPANDWATILPSRTTNVSVPTSYTLSAVSAVHRM